MMASRLGVSRTVLFFGRNANVKATRGVKTLDFAGSKEVVYERADWPLDKLQE